jgi:tetratricopeptide (TPR) repeat protein
MSQRFGSLLRRLRRILLSAGYAAGVLYFWLGAHEVFEGPKTHAVMLYSLLLAALAWPLLAARLPWAWARQRQALAVGGLLLGATLLSWLGAYAVLPANLALSVERTLPVIVAAFGALLLWLEDEDQRQGVLFTVLATHWALLFYGLLQVLDQNWGQAHNVPIDVIRWVRFGESRVYSTLGNPDYMSAHLTLFGALWLGLGWRRLDPRGPAQAAALALLAVPLALLPLLYGWASLGPILGRLGPWLGIGAGLFFLCRRLSARACWVLGLGLIAVLVVLAQGRGAWLAYAMAALAMALGGWALQGRAFFAQRWPVLRFAVGAALAGVLLLAALWAGRALAPEAAWTRQGAPAKALAVIDSVAYRLTHIFDKANAAQVMRRFYWRAAWQLGVDHPLLGVGYGNHALFTAGAQSKVWKQWEAAGDPRVLMVEPHVELYTHNDLLQNFAETGLPGLLAFLLFWAWFVREAWRLAREGRDAGDARRLELGLGLLGLAAAFSANALTNFPWRVLATQQLCWFAFALLALARAPRDGQAAPAVPPLRREALIAGVLLAGFVSLIPLRWSSASLFIRQGNQYKDAPGTPQPQGGIFFYERAVKAGLSGTQQVELLLYLGSLYNQLGQSDKALHWFHEGIKRYPDFLEAWYNVGFTWQRRFETSRDPSDLQKAIEAYEKVLDINPRALNALNNLGNLRYQGAQLEEALALYQRLLRFNPSSQEGWYNLGATQVRLGQREAAEASLEEALKLNAQFEPALGLLRQLKALPKGTVLPRG